jgi:hypothetical protein
MENNLEINKKIELLNRMGRIIVKIDECYFDITASGGGSFEPASLHVTRTVLKGRNITEFLKETNIILTPDMTQQQQQLTSQIEQIALVKREYSNHYSFINYLSN